MMTTSVRVVCVRHLNLTPSASFVDVNEFIPMRRRWNSTRVAARYCVHCDFRIFHRAPEPNPLFITLKSITCSVCVYGTYGMPEYEMTTLRAVGILGCINFWHRWQHEYVLRQKIYNLIVCSRYGNRACMGISRKIKNQKKFSNGAVSQIKFSQEYLIT